MNVFQILALARKHLGGDMESSARLCLADAVKLYDAGDLKYARARALRSRLNIPSASFTLTTKKHLRNKHHETRSQINLRRPAPAADQARAPMAPRVAIRSPDRHALRALFRLCNETLRRSTP